MIGLYQISIQVRMQKQANKYKFYSMPYFQSHWKETLNDLERIKSKDYQDIEDLQRILERFYSRSCPNSIFPELCALKQQPIKYIKDTFSNIAKFVISQEPTYKENPQKFPLLQKGMDYVLTLSKKQVVLLMSFSALCLNSLNHGKTYHNQVNFVNIFAGSKTPFILNYFDLVLDSGTLKKEEEYSCMSITRKTTKQFVAEDILNTKQTLKEVRIVVQGSIEDYNQENTIKVDFANKFIGGGALGHGCVQEQIMFLNHPELFVTMLICEVMNPNQAIGVHGFIKYFKNSGYGFSTQYDGVELSMKYVKDKDMHANDYIVAIDALARPKKQFSRQATMRQINKSYAGFILYPEVKTISTGNWGCGVFGGNPQYKFIIQWMSATLAKKGMIYYPFKDQNMKNMGQIAKLLEGKRVDQVFRHLLCFQSQPEKTVFQHFRAFKSQ